MHFALLFVLGCPGPDSPPTKTSPPVVLINEVQSNNQSTLKDPANAECSEFDDWIEIVNPTDDEQDLTDLQLEDESGRPYAFPEHTMQPGERFLVWADGQIGSISVANPPTECPPVLPEQTRVTAAGVERISESSELESGDEVLTDTQLLTMFEQSKAVAEASEKVDAPA
jgi:hypothetical protein